MELRKFQLNELQPGKEDPRVTALGKPHVKNLHKSMLSFWDLFTSDIIEQTFTCHACKNVTTQNESITELMMKFPPAHHIQQGQTTCTLDNLFKHNRSMPSDIEEYECHCCNMHTVTTLHKEISVYPKFVVIVLCREIRIAKRNTNNIKTVNKAVEFTLEDLCFLQFPMYKNNWRW